MWLTIDAWGNVEDGVAVQSYLLSWSNHVGEQNGGVLEQGIAQRSCCLDTRLNCQGLRCDRSL